MTAPRPSLPVLVALVLAAACTPAAPRTESSADTCSNGRDDDGDALVDCRDPACTIFTFCAGTDGGPPDAGPVDAPPFDGDAPGCGVPLDIVLVLDVSSSMPDDLMRVRDAVPGLFDAARALDATATLSLVVFVDDVLAVNACAPYASSADLVAEIDRRIAAAPANTSPVSGVVNQDCMENALDALFDASTMCTWRPGAEHTLVLVTDDTFGERPRVLSGEWGGGVFVATTYAEALTALSSRAIRLVAVAQSGAGDPCGAGTSLDVGQGFFTPYMDMTSLPDATGGVAIDLREVRDGRVALGARLADLLCAP